MAILEFEFKGIDQNFRSSAANVLKDIDKIKSAFSGIGGGSVDVSGLKKGMDEVRASIKLAESDNKMFLATKLADTRQAGIEELNAIRSTETQKQQAYRTTGEAWKAQREQEKNIGVGLDNSFKETRNSIAKLNEEQKKYNATQRETRDALKAVASERPYTQLTAEMNRVRKEAQDLGAQMIRLEIAGDKTSAEYIQLATAFKTAQQSLNPLDTAVKKLDGTLGQHQRNVGNYQNKMSGANGVTMEFNRIIQDAPFGMMGIGNNIQQLAANWQHYTTQQRTAADGTKIAVSNMTLLRGAISNIFSAGNLLTLGIAAITSAWTYYTMNIDKAKESTKELSNSFVSQLGTLNLLINSLEKGVKTQRDKSTAVALYNKELGDTLGKVKSYAELENKLIKNAPNYIQYLSLKARAEGAYQLSLEKTKKLLNDNINLSENKRVSGIGGWLTNNIQNPVDNFFDNAFKTIGAPDLSGLRTNDITPEEAMAIAGLPSQKEFDKSIKYFSSSIQHGLVEMRKQNKTLESTDDLWAKLSKKANEYADTLGLEMPELNLDKEKNLPNIFDYLTKIKDLLGDKRKDLDMFGLKGEAKDLKELEYSFKDFFSELNKLSSKLAKDDSISKSLKATIQGEISNAKKLGEELKGLQEGEITNKWLQERTNLIDELEGKLDELGQSEIDKRLNDWSKQIDKFKESIIATGVPLAQFQGFIDEMTEKGKFQIVSEFTTKNINEWSKENDKIADNINKPFSGTSRRQMQKDLNQRLYDLKNNLEKQAELAKQIGVASSDFTPNTEEFIQQIKIKWEQEIETTLKTEEAKKDIQDYTNILKTGIDNVFTNLKTNIDEFGWKAESVFYSLGETVGDMLKQVANKNTAKFMEKLTEGAKDFKGLSDNFKDMWKNDKGLVIGAGLGYAGGAISGLTPQTSSGGQAIGGALSGAAAGMAFGPWGAAVGAVVGGVSGLLKAAKNKRQEKILLQQYEEQKKANVLLERMSALTYASQIIGQKTEYGIVSGVRRNEFGQIVSVVQGQDIIMVADRANKQKQR